MLGYGSISSTPLSAPSTAVTRLAASSATVGGLANTTALAALQGMHASQTVGGLTQFTASADQVGASQTLGALTSFAGMTPFTLIRFAASVGGLAQKTVFKRAALINTVQTVGGVTSNAEAIVYWNLPNCGWINLMGDALDAALRHLPEGTAWLAWRWPGKTAFKLMSGIGRFFDEAMATLCNLSRELDPRTTEAMLPEWEAALSLPDKCLPVATTVVERRRLVWFRLQKKRWRSADDWKTLAAMFGLKIDVTPGWYVQQPALYDQCYPVRYDLFPRLGRFRVYIDVLNVNYPGYDYGDADTGSPGYPIPYGYYNADVDAFMCLINRVKPANVLVIWNQYPTKMPCVLPFPDVPELDFSKVADSQYIPIAA